MAELYPAINKTFEKSGFSFKPGENVLRTQSDHGPPQTRRTTTKRIDSFKGVLRFSETELDTFETWYSSTLKDGSLSFTFTHPIKGTEIECKFSGPYEYRAIGFETYEVNLELIII